MVDKKSLSERDICTKFIIPALEKAGWDRNIQIREEVYLTDGKIFVRGSLHTRAHHPSSARHAGQYAIHRCTRS